MANVITNNINLQIAELTEIGVELGDETVNDISVKFEESVFDITHTNDTGITVEVGESGPPGSGLGTMLQDYSIKGQFFTWNGVGDISVDYGNTAQIVLEGPTIFKPVRGWPGVGEEGKLTLYIQQGGGAHDVTWPAGILWVNGNQPVLSIIPGAWDVIVLTTIDSGTTVFGFHVGVT